MVLALGNQKGISHQYGIRYVPSEVEKYAEESNLSDMGQADVVARICDTGNETIPRMRARCVFVSMLHEFALFGRLQPAA